MYRELQIEFRRLGMDSSEPKGLPPGAAVLYARFQHDRFYVTQRLKKIRFSGAVSPVENCRSQDPLMQIRKGNGMVFMRS